MKSDLARLENIVSDAAEFALELGHEDFYRKPHSIAREAVNRDLESREGARDELASDRVGY